MFEVPDLGLGVARITTPVAIGVGLVGVAGLGAVVGVVQNAIPIGVAATVIGVAGVALAIVVIVGLVGVGVQRAVIGFVGHSVAIVIIIADIALAVGVGVELVAIGVQGAVIGLVDKGIAVVVSVAGVALAIVVGVGLCAVEVGRTVVAGIDHAVAIGVGFSRGAGQVARTTKALIETMALATDKTRFALGLGFTCWRIGEARAATDSSVTDEGRRAVPVQLTEDQQALALSAHIVSLAVGLRPAWLVAIGARSQPTQRA